MPTRCRGDQVHCRLGAQHTTDPVEIAGRQVDQLHQPLAQSAESLGGDTHAAIAHRLVGRRKIARQLADGCGRYATTLAHGLGAIAGDGLAYLVQPIYRQVAGAGQVLLEQGIE
ncbi:hypothetical protein FQZ97_1105010 [compost metagenome]